MKCIEVVTSDFLAVSSTEEARPGVNQECSTASWRAGIQVVPCREFFNFGGVLC